MISFDIYQRVTSLETMRSFLTVWFCRMKLRRLCALFKPVAACQFRIKQEKKCSIIKYHVEGREETDLKAHHLYRPCLRRRVLKFLQNGKSLLRRIWATTGTAHGEVSIALQVWIKSFRFQDFKLL